MKHEKELGEGTEARALPLHETEAARLDRIAARMHEAGLLPAEVNEQIRALHEIVRELRNALLYYADADTGWELCEHADAYEDSRRLVPDDGPED